MSFGSKTSSVNAKDVQVHAPFTMAVELTLEATTMQAALAEAAKRYDEAKDTFNEVRATYTLPPVRHDLKPRTVPNPEGGYTAVYEDSHVLSLNRPTEEEKRQRAQALRAKRRQQRAEG